MPPKKKEEEVDISTLTPIYIINCVLSYSGSQKRASQLYEQLQKNPKSFQRNILRTDILEYAEKQNLYINPDNLTDKQKKDAKFMETVNLECTPTVVSKALSMYMLELYTKERKLNQNKIDGIEPEQVVEKKGPPAKAKIDPKTKKPIVEEVKVEEEVPKVPEKNYGQNFDILNFVFDVPNNKQEMFEYYQQPVQKEESMQSRIDFIVNIVEKEVKQELEDLDLKEQSFEGQFEKRLNKQVEGEEQEEQIDEEQPQELDEDQIKELEAKKIEEERLAEEEKLQHQKNIEFNEQNEIFFSEIVSLRNQQPQDSKLRQTVIKEIVFDVDTTEEENSRNQFVDQLLEEIVIFGQDQVQFKKWMEGKKCMPLITPEENVEQQITEIQNQINNPETLNTSCVAEENPCEKPEIQQEKPLQNNWEQFKHYKKYIEQNKMEQFGTGVFLSGILEEIYQNNKTDGETEQINQDDDEFESTMEDIDGFLKRQTDIIMMNYNQENEENDMVNTVYNTLNKDIFDEFDYLSLKYSGQKNKYQAAEYQLIQSLLYPGINRNQMPAFPEKSVALRKAEKSQFYPFTKVKVQEFERRQCILKFEELFQEKEPDRSWDFGNRLYIEKINLQTLIQELNMHILYEPHIIHKYNDKDDTLMVGIYYKNPQGRILRKRWNADWKVLPNLENWINYFKNMDNNYNNEQYYDIDYQQIGNINEKTKFMYPSDDAIIIAQKYEVSEKLYYRHKIKKEQIIFGIKARDERETAFYLKFNNNTLLQSFLETENQYSFSVTLPFGLIIKFLPNSDILQTKVKPAKQLQNQGITDVQQNFKAEIQETFRIITSKGSVIRYLIDGSIQILYSNGNVSNYRAGIWTNVNNKGLKYKWNIKEDCYKEDGSIPCAKRTDPEQGSKITIRGDQTIIIKYKDNSVFTKHADGTQLFTSADKNSVIIEHQDFASVKILFDQTKARLQTIIGQGSSSADVGFDNLFERSFNGRMAVTYIPDGSIVQSYYEKQELLGYNSYKENNIHLYYSQDESIIKMMDDGEVVVISGNDKNKIIQGSGQDNGYWLQLFCIPEERGEGVYSIDLKEHKITNKDGEGNYFLLTRDEAISKISVSIKNQDRPQTPDFYQGEYIEEENKYLPQPETWLAPRLFIINNETESLEFLNEEQLAAYFRDKSKNKFTTKLVEQSSELYDQCEAISFITEFQPSWQNKTQLIDPSLPRNVDIIPKTEKSDNQPEHKCFTFRNLAKFPVFEGEIRQEHLDNLKDYEKWKNLMKKQANEYGIIKQNEQEELNSVNIALKIIENRRLQLKIPKYDDFKDLIWSVYSQKYPFEHTACINTLEDLQNVKTIKEIYELRDQQEQEEGMELDYVQPQKSINLEKEKEVDKVKNEKTQLQLKFVHNYFETQQGKSVPQNDLAIYDDAKNRFKPNQEDIDKLLSQGKEQAQIVYDEIEKSQVHEQQPQQTQSVNQEQYQNTINKQSVFALQDQQMEQVQQNTEKDALLYRKQKTKLYNVYGSERLKDETNVVPGLNQTKPESELNQKYIMTESMTDNRVKTASLAQRVYLHAPSVQEVRQAGQHQLLAQTNDKRNIIQQMEERKGLMIQANLNDRLKKDISVTPNNINFGVLRRNSLYEMRLKVKNEDVLVQRVNIKQPESKNIKIFQSELGPIAQGLVRDVIVRVDANKDLSKGGEFNSFFQLITKSEIYKIPIKLHVVSEQEYDEQNQDSIRNNGVPILKRHVKELKLKNQMIQQDEENNDVLPKIGNYDKSYMLNSNLPVKKEKEESEKDF